MMATKTLIMEWLEENKKHFALHKQKKQVDNSFRYFRKYALKKGLDVSYAKYCSEIFQLCDEGILEKSRNAGFFIVKKYYGKSLEGNCKLIPKYHFFETVVYAEMPNGEVWWCDPSDPPREETYLVRDNDGERVEEYVPVGGWQKIGPVTVLEIDDETSTPVIESEGVAGGGEGRKR